MKVTVIPTDQRQLKDWQSRLDEAGVPYELVTKKRRVALELDRNDAEYYLGLKPKKKTPIWKYALYVIAGLLVIGLVIPSTGEDSSDTNVLIDAPQAIGAAPSYFQELWGAPEATEETTDSYPCEDGTCTKITYMNGTRTAWFQNGECLYFSIDTTLMPPSSQMIEWLGIKRVTPTSSMNDNFQWKNLGGLNITINSVGLMVKKLSDEERLNLLRAEKIKDQFSPWDGSHVNLTKAIKKAMNDPKSYEHVETTHQDMGDYILVVTQFRGTNAFGGKVLNEVTAKVDINGNIIEVLE